MVVEKILTHSGADGPNDEDIGQERNDGFPTRSQFPGFTGDKAQRTLQPASLIIVPGVDLQHPGASRATSCRPATWSKRTLADASRYDYLKRGWVAPLDPAAVPNLKYVESTLHCGKVY